MDDFDDLSYSFYTDNRVGYIDSEDNEGLLSKLTQQ